MKYELLTKPNWAFEIANCLHGQNNVNADEFVSTASEKGMSQKQAEEYISRYRKFSDRIEGKIFKAAEKYPDLYRFFKPLECEIQAEYYILPNIFYHYSNYFFDVDEDGKVIKCLKSIDEVTEIFPAGKLPHIMAKAAELPDKNGIIEIKSNTPEQAEYDAVLAEAMNYTMYKVLTYFAGDDAVIPTKRKESVSDMAELVSLLDLLDHPDDLKFKLIMFYSKGIQIVYDFISLLEETVPVCMSAFPIIKEDYEKTVSELMDETKTIEEINTLIGIRLDFSIFYCMRVSILRYNIFMILDGGDNYHICIGMYIFDMVRRKNVHAPNSNLLNDEKLISQLKAISEPSRLHILKLLAQSSRYMQELANELSLTTATVSHHLTTLMQCDLIQIVLSADKKKVYYQINEYMINALPETIKALIGHKN